MTTFIISVKLRKHLQSSHWNPGEVISWTTQICLSLIISHIKKGKNSQILANIYIVPPSIPSTSGLLSPIALRTLTLSQPTYSSQGCVLLGYLPAFAPNAFCLIYFRVLLRSGLLILLNFVITPLTKTWIQHLIKHPFTFFWSLVIIWKNTLLQLLLICLYTTRIPAPGFDSLI